MNIIFTSYIATSLDGFVARLNGKLDWLDAAAEKGSKEDYGYLDFMSTIDCIVMGRNTFEKVASFPDWPYNGKRVIVLSKTMKEPPSHLAEKVSFFSGKIALLAVELQNLKLKRVYVDGSMTIQSFINAKLLDELIVTSLPVLIGRGISLFGPVKDDVALKLLENKSFSSGFVQSHYQLCYAAGKFFD